MKNKKVTYLLLTCVLALWGVIFFRIFSSMGSEDVIIAPASKDKVEYFNLVNHATDTIALRLNYRNPFATLGTTFISEKIDYTLHKEDISKRVAVAPIVKWSSIQYTGYINNATTKRKVTILIIDGKEFMLSDGQHLNGIKLIKNETDSVKLQFQKETKYIKLK